jgi:hypothetical protein
MKIEQNRTMKPVEIVLKGGDEGEQWKGESN